MSSISGIAQTQLNKSAGYYVPISTPTGSTVIDGNLEVKGFLKVDEEVITNKIIPIDPGQVVEVDAALFTSGYLKVSDYQPGVALRVQGDLGGPNTPAIYQDISSGGSLTLASNNTKASNLVLTDTQITTSVPLYSQTPDVLSDSKLIDISGGGFCLIDFTGQTPGIFDCVAGAVITGTNQYMVSTTVYWDGTNLYGGSVGATVYDLSSILITNYLITSKFGPSNPTPSGLLYEIVDKTTLVTNATFNFYAFRRTIGAALP
jgi:hypothetical protein